MKKKEFNKIELNIIRLNYKVNKNYFFIVIKIIILIIKVSLYIN
jgi:hypothetical protein